MQVRLRKIRTDANTRFGALPAYRRSVYAADQTRQGEVSVVVCLSGHRVEEVSIRPEHVFVLDRLPPRGLRTDHSGLYPSPK